ncbi:50S ribosomal protein L37ae [Candidatus Woesearchaeota archaeon]|nr:50S ribosomal protein L37ae [Candidatus Woesearchaeota archaeon]
MSTTKRFGTRYGRKLKVKFGQIEAIQRSKQKCPYCKKFNVKRVAMGIWLCSKCKVKFTGKAYSI